MTFVVIDNWIWKAWQRANVARGAFTFSFVVLAIVMLLQGCAGQDAFREGNVLMAEGRVDEGLGKLEEAVRLEPGNAEYRITLASHRARIVNRLMMAGETARRDGRLAEAEKAYRQVLVYDRDHPMARQGLDALITERRHRQVVAAAETTFKKGGKADLDETQLKLREVLAENPHQKDALNLKARIDDALAKERQPQIQLAEKYNKPVTLEFTDAPLKSIFDLIAKVSGLNFFFDKDIRPDLKATIYTKSTSVEDAVRLLLVTNQLEQKILNENSILVYPNTPQKVKDYKTLTIRTFYLANADVKAVSSAIKTIVKTNDMVVDERLGLIIVRDTPEAIRLAERIVALQDLADPEVMLEVEILEVKRSRLLELGVRWPSQLTLSPLQTGDAPITLDDLQQLDTSTTAASIGSAQINLRKEDQDANVLANPRIRVRNKEKAKILIGDKVPVITATTTSTGVVSESVNYVDVGLKLDVEPNIYLDEEVAIKVNLEVSSLVREVFSKSGTLSYQIGTRGANTVLRLKDGETQVLAGLISDEERTSANKIPALGDMPLLGRLFGSQKDDNQRSEILLSITPHVVRSIRRPDLISAEFESGTESNIGTSLTLRTVEDSPAPKENGKSDSSSILWGREVQGSSTGKQSSTPSAETTEAANGTTLSWQAPAQVRGGEQFTAVLRIDSNDVITAGPLMIGFDPQLLQVMSVQEGDFFTQNSGQTNFSHRVDPAQGKIYVAVVRKSEHGVGAGINGTGSLVMVNFKASKANTLATIRLLSISPEPKPALPLRLPPDHSVRVVP